MDPVRAIADAVLYEGYVLWPYRRSALKNRKRWTLAGFYPRAYSETSGTNDPWFMQTQCLLLGNAGDALTVRVRFLQVVWRQALRRVRGDLEPVDELVSGGERHLSWEEAAEREIVLGPFGLYELELPKRAAVEIPAGSVIEELPEGALMRTWRSLSGTLEASAEHLGGHVYRLTARLANETSWPGGTREEVLGRTFVSAHAVLEADGASFVSMTDPPAELREEAGGCENVKTWPVLVGEKGRRDTVLSSPIILYDHPEIAPESPGDLFDGTEIDRLLIMNVLSLTDEEKEEVRATDPRVREILERCESLSPEELMRLSGAIREFRMLR